MSTLKIGDKVWRQTFDHYHRDSTRWRPFVIIGETRVSWLAKEESKLDYAWVKPEKVPKSAKLRAEKRWLDSELETLRDDWAYRNALNIAQRVRYAPGQAEMLMRVARVVGIPVPPELEVQP